MGMNSEGEIRAITPTEPLKPDEVLITEPEKEQLEKMTRPERRRIYRQLAKQQKVKKHGR